MASRGQHFLRATDDDRARAVDEIGNAYADGRLTLEEHDERSGAALEARTLGELAVLTADLQRPEVVPTPAAVVRNDGIGDLLRRVDVGAALHRRGLLAAVAAAVAVLALVVGVAAVSGGDDTDTVPTGGAAPAVPLPEPEVEPEWEGPSVLSADGFSLVLDALESDYGSARVTYATFYSMLAVGDRVPDDYAVAQVLQPDDDRLVESTLWRQGELTSSGEGNRSADGIVIDLRDVDVDRFVSWGTRVARRVGTEDPVLVYANVSDDPSDGAPRIVWYAIDRYDDLGHLTTTLDGRLLDVYPNDG